MGRCATDFRIHGHPTAGATPGGRGCAIPRAREAHGPGHKPETDRVDPESGSTLRLLEGFPVKLLGQLAIVGSIL